METRKKVLLFYLRLTMILLLVLSVPWYGTPEYHQIQWLGMPAWVTRALFCYALIVVINLLAWMLFAYWAREPDSQ